MSEERLQKVLARAGLGSRRSSETLISAGRVKVNGKVATLGVRVRLGQDRVTVDGKPIEIPSDFGYFLFYKPSGVMTTLRDPEGRPSVGDWLAKQDRRLIPVGRLDWDAEGALLLTDDGSLAQKLLHPRYGVRRTYLAKVRGHPPPEVFERLLKGVELDDGMARAKVAKPLNTTEKNAWVELVVEEGRYHMVKRMLAAVGHPVARLYRPHQAGVSVEGMSPGELRPLRAEEVRNLQAISVGAPVEVDPPKLPARRNRWRPGASTSGKRPSEEAGPPEGDDE